LVVERLIKWAALVGRVGLVAGMVAGLVTSLATLVIVGATFNAVQAGERQNSDAMINKAPVNHNLLKETQAVVLMYHHFGVEKHASTNIRLSQFDAHLDYLEKEGYEIWPLRKIVKYVEANRVFPARVVAITIDDAYKSVFTEAYPRLKKRGWPFTVFVASDGVDSHFPAYMSWPQMREMQDNGASFENHSASHDYLIRVMSGETEKQWQVRIRADILKAQRRIEEELGRSSTLFAYPYGEYNTALATLVAELGLRAFGQQSGPVGLGADTRSMPRFPMAERFAEMADFKQKVASLAFPVLAVQPWDPLLSAPVNPDAAPQMRLHLAKSSARLAQLSCFVSGQGRVDVKWLDRADRLFMLQAPQPLQGGRSRYNCTAPSTQPGRYYWFSHLWISN